MGSGNEKAGPLSKSRPTSSSALVKAQAEDSPSAVWTSTTRRRCPWFAEVVERAARPGAWRATAIVHAGSGAWQRAREIREGGRRACTCLVPGVDPTAVVWPSVSNWIGDAGDLGALDAVELARCLIDAGVSLVQMVGDNLKPSLIVRRARHAVGA